MKPGTPPWTPLVTLACICACFWLQGPPSAAEVNFSNAWPQFRGPTGDGVSLATNIPIHWGTNRNVVWKTPIPGEGWSSPIVADGRIYLTSATDESALRVLCVNATDGSLIWNTEVFRPQPGDTRQIHRKNSLASPTAIVAGNRIYAHFGHMGTAALDREGAILWRQTDLRYSPVHGNGSSPALWKDRLIIPADGAANPILAAIGTASGEVLWKTPRRTHARAKFSFATPLLIELEGRPLAISPASGFVGAYDPETGSEVWRVTYGEGYSVVPRPVYAGGLLIVSSGFDRPVLYAIDPDGAHGDATESAVAWRQPRGAPTTPSPIVSGEAVFIVSDSGIASSLDLGTGKTHWQERLGGNFSASPVLVEGRLYFTSEEGVTHVLRASTDFEVLARNSLEERVLASPAVIDNALFLRSEQHLWRIGLPALQ